jgi:hypothetical protein
MSDKFHLRFCSSTDSAAAEQKMLALHVDGRAAVRCFPNENGFIAGCAIFNELAPDARLTNGSRSVPFGEIFYHVDLTKSGMHDRPGLLWIRLKDVAGKMHPNPVALADVAPTVLGLMGLNTPSEMRGRDLLAAPGAQVRAA